VSAQLRTLSDVIAEEGIERIDLLKINVEKSELDVLRGIRSEDWPRIRQLVVEVDRDANLEPILSLLEGQGFDVLAEQDTLLQRTELCYVYAIRPSAGSALVREQGADAHLRSLAPLDGEILTPATLRKRLKERLPSHMIPAAFMLLEKLPLTSNGKVDRQALPALSHDRVPAAPSAAGPSTETEKALAAIWRELLNIESIGVHDDFFDLGGQSLVAIKAVSRIRDAFDVDLPLRNLFERPTVAGLAEVIDGLAWVARAPVSGQGSNREEVEL
jgi:iturin family lipopeptide synthetase A